MEKIRLALQNFDLVTAAKEIVKHGRTLDHDDLQVKELQAQVESLVEHSNDTSEAIRFVCQIAGCSSLSVLDRLAKYDLFPSLIMLEFYLIFFQPDIEHDLQIVALLLKKPETVYSKAFGPRFASIEKELAKRQRNPEKHARVWIEPDERGVRWTATFSNIPDQSGTSSCRAWARADSKRVIHGLIGVADNIEIEYI